MNSKSYVILFCLCIASTALGEEVVFKNGDKLTGKVTRNENGKMTIEQTIAGTVVVDSSQVADIHADATTTQAGTTQAATSQPTTVESVAATAPEAAAAKWTGKFVLGAEMQRGNSHTDKVNAEFDAEKRRVDDRFTLGAAYAFGRERAPDTNQSNTTTDNWTVSGKYDYFFTPKFYQYELLKLERDNVANLDIRISPNVGLGYQWSETPEFKFNTEAGVGYVYESFENDGTDEHFAIRLAYHLDKKINDKVNVFHNLEYLPGVPDVADYNLNADAGLHVALSGSWFAEFKLEWKYDSKPAPDAMENDLRYVLGIGWNF